MPPPNATAAYHLIPYPKTLYLYQFRSNASLPVSLLSREETDAEGDGGPTFKSITWTKDETSIITDKPIEAYYNHEGGGEGGGTGSVPNAAHKATQGPERYAALAIRGPMDLSLTGVLCALITPLKAANIAIFTISTWNTDYLLVPLAQKERAIEVLSHDGWSIDI
ncbi:hypothetical protein FRB91_004597 [Serendipita sp. 411]|nr:hypothetical protein FRB91_004597 [Serendipita sp. 411]